MDADDGTLEWLQDLSRVADTCTDLTASPEARLGAAYIVYARTDNDPDSATEGLHRARILEQARRGLTRILHDETEKTCYRLTAGGLTLEFATRQVEAVFSGA